ncbi:phage tail tape measure protein [Curtobacterium sp. MCBA15_004]|uniref:phage tail tape measure protein n=1 Tax=Curtobacterium sp. MCBA15_004 TaxID=1898733 RepID=UPI0008DCD86C|nr:phage tail tape measure protein [Curtobacterium sp. MCBA15_004]WIA96408.1 phage tail tape measure protein [Curtobacterium sp. MCBA15_004]WIA97619.1 phage tail tape measure protein [Curtobacterium sp. MCBA15_004]
MADRIVRVVLQTLSSNYVQGMHDAENATNDTANAAHQQAEAMEKLGKVFLGVGAAAAGFVVLAVKSFADFDAQMSQVKSLSHATAYEMDQLRNAALTMGQGIGFSATEVAEAETELVKAGVSVKDILGGGLKGALNLAAAGQLDVAKATEIAAIAMTQFGLKGSEVPHIADLLAAGADKALGSVEDLGMALNQSGLVAAQFGLSVDDTVGTLSAFAQAGLLGSDAGTSFKTMLTQLANPSQQSAELMQKLGIVTNDANGQFIGITKLAGVLHDQLGSLTQAQRNQALAQIFGNDAIRAANVLYQNGASGIQGWITSVDDTGFAAVQASGKMDNLNGDVKKLGSAFEAGLIKSGSAANVQLRGMVQGLSDLINAFVNAPGWVQATVLAIAALTAGIGLLGGGILTIVPKVAAARAAMAAMQLSAGNLALTIGKGGAVLIGIAAIVSGLTNLGSQTDLTVDQLASLNAALKTSSPAAIDKEFTGGGGAFDAIGVKANGLKDALAALNGGANQTSIGMGKFLDGATFGLAHVSDTAKRFEASFRAIGQGLAQMADSDLKGATAQFREFVKEAGGGKDAVEQLLEQMPDYKAKLIDLAGAQGKNLSDQELYNLAQGKGALATKLMSEATDEQQKKLAELSGKAQQGTQDIGSLADAIRNFGKGQLDVNDAERQFQQAIDDATASVKENTGAVDAARTSFDLGSEAGRNASGAIDGIASAAKTSAAALFEQSGSQDVATAKLAEGRQALINALGAYGITGQAAEDYANKVMGTPQQWATNFTNSAPQAGQKVTEYQAKLNALPADRQTQVNAATDVARRGVQSVLDTLNAIPNEKRITITTNRVNVGDGTPGNGLGVMKAAGGAIHGPGTGTSDSIPAWLSNGEHVLTASDVQKLGGQAAVYGLRAAIQRGQAPRYAVGGAVSYAPQVQRFAAPPQATEVGPRIGTVQNNIVSPDPTAAAMSVVRRLNALGA